MKTIICCVFCLTVLLTLGSLSIASRPEHESFEPFKQSLKAKPTANPGSSKGGGGGNDAGIGGFFGPGTGYIPGFGKGWGNNIIGGGYGAGYGGPKGGYSKGGVVRPGVVCKERGPCFNKKLTCPAKCFTSYSRAGKGYGGGGGGGGCTMDCKKNCIAYC